MHATNLCNEFVEHGYSADILVTGEMSEKPFFTAEGKVNIISLDDYCSSHPLKKGDTYSRGGKIRRLKRVRYAAKIAPALDKKLEQRINFLRSGEKLRLYFLDNPGAVVIAFGIPYIKGTLSATEKLGCRVIYAEKNAPEKECPKDSKEFSNQISLLKKADAVVVQTHDSKAYYSDYLDNVAVINNPIKANLPQPFCGKRSKRIVNFCRISEQKNLDLLLDAFQKLHQEYPDYSVEIYGNIVFDSEKQYKEKIIKKADDLGLSDCFKVLPPAADVHGKVLDAAMFVSSSDYEGLSNSMIEAMAIGLPCICTDCLGGGTREVLTDHENGLIVPMNDPESLYKAMKEYIEDPDLAEKCSKNAFRIRDKLDVKRIAKQWLEIIEKN